MTNPEQFDINQAAISGAIQRIWDRDGDIYLRLAFKPDPEKPARFLSLRLPKGRVAGKSVSLQPGERVFVQGYLVDSPYIESIQNFLGDARKAEALEAVSNPDEWRMVQIKRVGTRLDVTDLAFIDQDSCQKNWVVIQGIAAKVWESGENLMVRLAIYDEHTPIIGENPHKHKPRRKPHYVTVRILGGEIDGKALKIGKRVRLRISGSLHIRFYRETLREILIRNGAAALLDDANGIEPDEIYAVRDTVSVTAESVIVLASLGRAVS